MARQPAGSSGFAPPRAIEAWRVLRVPMCLYKRRMRRLAREREGGRERKSDNGDGGLFVMRYKDPRDVRQSEGTLNFSEGVQGAKKKTLMNPGVLNRRAVFPPKFLA